MINLNKLANLTAYDAVSGRGKTHAMQLPRQKVVDMVTTASDHSDISPAPDNHAALGERRTAGERSDRIRDLAEQLAALNTRRSGDHPLSHTCGQTAGRRLAPWSNATAQRPRKPSASALIAAALVVGVGASLAASLTKPLENRPTLSALPATPVQGLALVEAGWDLAPHPNGQALLIWGEIANNGPEELILAPIELQALGPQDEEHRRWRATPKQWVLPPGSRTSFQELIIDFNEAISNIHVEIAPRPGPAHRAL